MISCPCRRFNRCSFFGSPYICTDVHFLPRRINRRSNLYKAVTVLGFPISSHNHAAATPAARTVPRPLLRALLRPPPPPRPRRRAAASPPCAAARRRLSSVCRGLAATSSVRRRPPPPRPRRHALAVAPPRPHRRYILVVPRPRRRALAMLRHRPPRRHILITAPPRPRRAIVLPDAASSPPSISVPSVGSSHAQASIMGRDKRKGKEPVVEPPKKKKTRAQKEAERAAVTARAADDQAAGRG
jgi:hypothetical protein